MSFRQYDPWQKPAEGSAAQAGPAYAPYQEYDPGDRPHSGLGIASFLLGLLSLLLVAVPLVYGVYLAIDAAAAGLDQPQIDETDPIIAVVGCAGLLGLVSALVGAGLGIGALFAKGRRKWPAVTGLVINGGTLLIFGGMMLLSLIANIAMA